MSDHQIEWIPVAIWSTGVFLQVDSAIRSWWMNRGARDEQRRLIESDWAKIQRGETKRGFRKWFERQCCPKKSILDERSHYYPLQMPFPKDNDYNEWIKRELMSVFMTIDHPMPNSNQYVQNLRRYSFFDPAIYTDIARVIYSTGNGWLSVFDIQLDDRTVASVFKNYFTGRICVILIDIKQRSYRHLIIPPILPVFESSIRILYVRRGEGKRSNRLRIVCGSSQWDRHEIISIDYEVRPSKKNPLHLFAVEVGRQSIVIPGNRKWFASSFPGTHILKATEPNQAAYIITIDDRGDFRVHHHDEWDQWTSDFERRSSKAVHDFEAMLPESECYFRRYYKHILGIVGDTYAKRQIYPPSMMHLAAEAICQAKTRNNADLSMIKSETGIDMFDEIFEDREKPVPTIYLPSEDELIQ